MSAYLEIFAGDTIKHEKETNAYDFTRSLISKHGPIFDLPALPELLSDEQREILQDLNKSSNQDLRFDPPVPLLLGRITFDLDPSPGLNKTRQNFISLCTGDRGLCKSAPNKKLHYLGCPIHRVVKGFVAQGGDVTRSDGSGGETWTCLGLEHKTLVEKAGLQVLPQRGSLAMANSGGKSPNNTSQFFVVLSSDDKIHSKLKGKYVVFGRIRKDDEEGDKVLEKLNELGASGDSKDEKPLVPVWIGGCGVL
ncbi:cyclophilin-like domain-containing protein [Lentinula edodes]|uniref:cyclophilin-like domain-containing protein n=1 Tax=Lentinula edodes TaxID=5353 RepID=UPI001E8D0194|nr:cyclophilin-like domain-containing protein [Lentinula edodes]KAH7878194.1 cyclophilin-like domain-containing protein [Lentinula edodes]